MAAFPKAGAVALGVSFMLSVTAYAQTPAYRTVEIPFTSHDGHAMFGRLSLPDSPGPHPVVVYVQTAEAQNVDTRVQGPKGPLDVFDQYRAGFSAAGVGFFSYEGRGVKTGTQPPRYVQIDWPVYDTSTLENKVRDAVSAVRLLQKQAGVDAKRILLRGHSEGSLLAAEAAARLPGEVSGVVLSGVITTMGGAIRFQVADGTFAQHQGHWDANRDGTITNAEFQADPRGIRKLMPAEVTLAVFDASGDGNYTVEDARVRAKPFIDALDGRNAAGVMPWLKASAAVEIPEGWLADHFAHQPIDAFLTQLRIPVGIFNGELDIHTPSADVRALEQRMKAAGRTNIEFQYFPGLDHGFGGMDYFFRGRHSAGYQAMFDWVKKQTATR